uniref:Uncharacterized protein n=1 Tax=Globisporangium ultimum (strain ATCC 200006 / CBS 805.95 / DAOM BR144) TaxID=431595 RepID=K3WQL0_GLOUD
MSIVKPAMPFVRRTSSQLQLTYTKLFSPKGLLGIEHPCFEQILLARELVEILSQGYQVYTSSTLVPRRWVNDLSAILLVINCWSTCLVQAVVPKPLTRQRAVCLAVDTLLDFTWTVIIPFCICLPYAMAYDPDIRAFPDELLGDNSWQLSWQMDIQQLCITSWMDFIAKMVPCVGMLASTRSITGVVVEERSIVKPAHIPRRLVKQRRHITLVHIMNSQALYHSLKVWEKQHNFKSYLHNVHHRPGNLFPPDYPADADSQGSSLEVAADFCFEDPDRL